MASYSDAEKAAGFGGGVLGSERPAADVINGWEIRNSGDSIALNGLVPFVQLIGLYNTAEIEKLTGTNGDASTVRRAVYVDEYQSETSIDNTDNATQIKEEQIQYFEDKIKSKYVKLSINGYSQGAENEFIPGIVLATNQPQIGNTTSENYVSSGLPKDSGGVGITDLQIETGTKEFANRRYKLRITVTDPQILNDQPEYLKLSSLQSTFLIIHGWSNPEAISGYDNGGNPINWEGDPAPRIEKVGDDPAWPGGEMTVDVTQENTGGAWSAAVVATTMFDFAFNEVGQLEASFTFMPRIISFLSTYRIPTVADNMRLFLGSGEQNAPVNRETGEQPSFQFAGFAAGFGSVAGEFGKNMADVIHEEQLRYLGKNEGISSLFENIDTNFSLANSLRDFSDTISDWSQSEQTGALFEEQKRQEGRNRFPFAGPGIRSYTSREIPVASPEDADNPDTYTQLNSHITYYYLGWILEAMRFSLWDINKNKVLSGDKPFDLKFKYAQIPEDSHFNLAFQDEVKAGVAPTLEGTIQEAIKQFKEKATPIKRLWNPILQELNPVGTNVRPNKSEVTNDDEEGGLEITGVFPITSAEIDEGHPALDSYEIMGDLNEDRFKDWETKSYYKKLKDIPGAVMADTPGTVPVPDEPILADKPTTEAETVLYRAAVAAYELALKTNRIAMEEDETYAHTADWRRSLVRDESPGNEGLVRIMHPRFEGQLLYNFKWKGELGVEFTSNYSKADCGLYSKEVDGKDWDKRGELYSKIKGFFFGQWTGGIPTADGDEELPRDRATGLKMGTGPESKKYGIICPAISARYFSGMHYKYAQQRWYNKHIHFLYSYFETVIRNRITNVFKSQNTVESIFEEPVDLLWLTGQKYEHPWNAVITNGVVGKYDSIDLAKGDGLWKKYGDRVDDRSEYTEEEFAVEIGRSTYNLNSTNADNEVYLSAKQNIASEKEEKFNTALNGSENLHWRRNNHAFARARQQLTNIDTDLDRYSKHIIGLAEDEMASIRDPYEGLNGVKDFWNERLNNILTDLYNKDLINLELTSSAPDPEETIASANAVPNNVIKISPTYKLQRSRIEGTTDRKYGNLIPAADGYRLIFFDLSAPQPAETDNGNVRYLPELSSVISAISPSPSLSTLRDEGKERYVATVWEPAGTHSLNFDTVDSIGEIKLELNNPGIEYIFMNYVDENAQNEFLSGHKMLEAGQQGNQGAARRMTSGYNSYLTYIIKRRDLIRRYLEKIFEINNKIQPLQFQLDAAQQEISEIEDKIIQTNAFNSALKDPETYRSKETWWPFAPRNPADSDYTQDIGGGRTLTVNGIVASYWSVRFSKRIVFGATDITNYIPSEGGVPIIEIDKSTYGWPKEINLNSTSQRSPYRILRRANLNETGNPTKILDIHALSSRHTYEWNNNTYNIRGTRGTKVANRVGNWINDQPQALLRDHSDLSPNNMYYSHPSDSSGGSTPEGNQEVDVIHLIRAGFVDTDMIKKIALNTYGWESVGFADDADDVSVTIEGQWPFFDGRYRVGRGSGDDESYIGPLYLVDDDLDFVVQVKDLVPADHFGKDALGNDVDDEDSYYALSILTFGDLGWYNKYEWVKIGHASGQLADGKFAPVPEGLTMAYPSSNGKRRAQNDHLPTLSELFVQNIAKSSSHNGSETENFNSAGRPAYDLNYPYGIPDGPVPSIVSDGYIAGVGGTDNVDFLGTYKNSTDTGWSVNTILNTLPDEFERGFFTSVKWADKDFGGGAPLNKGLEKYIATEFINLFSQGRRVAIRSTNSTKALNNPKKDVTYKDLFEEDSDSSTPPLAKVTMADFRNQTIQNVAEIPIKREVVDNLLSRNNANMSLLQFMQQILSPSSIGLAGNVHVGVRATSDNLIELIPASISYKGVTNDMFKKAFEANIGNDSNGIDQLLFDYKKRNSLIESIDMSSKMDPAAFLTYQNSSDLLRGRNYNVLKLLSYEGVAEDFKEFLDNTPKVDNSGETYTGIINIGDDNKVRIDKVKFDAVPSSIIDGVIAQNPERWARIVAIMQGSSNFTTELLAFYMRGVTLTIHGTTNIRPFNLINVTGVLPDLEGIYVVTNITEKITPTTFQTILEGKLIKRKRLVVDGDDVFI